MILQCSLQATYPDFTLDLAFTVQRRSFAPALIPIPSSSIRHGRTAV